MPSNIGLENFDLNNMINDYNSIVTERFRYINESGSNNYLAKSLEPQLVSLTKNISSSLINLSNSLDLKLKNLKVKENEFDFEYNKVPENEKNLRAIERELSIKEALYLLLLQKREEASINLAVVKPTIKIIDYPISDISSKNPSSRLIYLIAIIIPIIIYLLVLFVWFFLDNKIHSKQQLSKLINKDLPIIAEIPFIENIESIKNNLNSRSLIAESIRMLLSNLRFTSLKSNFDNDCQTIILHPPLKVKEKL